MLKSHFLVHCYYAESTATDECSQREAAAPTYLSESVSVLNATELPDYSLEQSKFETSIVDHASMSDGTVDSNPLHSIHYPRASEAFSPTLSLSSLFSKEDPYTYGGISDHYDRSQSMPPVNHRYRQEHAYFHTPTIRKQHPHIQRRFIYPPTSGYSFCTPSSSDLVYLSVFVYTCMCLYDGRFE